MLSVEVLLSNPLGLFLQLRLHYLPRCRAQLWLLSQLLLEFLVAVEFADLAATRNCFLANSTHPSYFLSLEDQSLASSDRLLVFHLEAEAKPQQTLQSPAFLKPGSLLLTLANLDEIESTVS